MYTTKERQKKNTFSGLAGHILLFFLLHILLLLPLLRRGAKLIILPTLVSRRKVGTTGVARSWIGSVFDRRAMHGPDYRWLDKAAVLSRVRVVSRPCPGIGHTTRRRTKRLE